MLYELVLLELVVGNTTVRRLSLKSNLLFVKPIRDFLYSLLAFLVSWCAYLFGLFLLSFLLLGKYHA